MIILAVLLLPMLGCGTESGTTATAERQADRGVLRPAFPSAAGEALCLAAEEGDIARVRSLIVDGADVNARDEGNATPLHRAAALGRREMVEFLITHGADVNATGGLLGGTPLCEAVAADYSLTAHELLGVQRPDLSYKDELYRELHEKLTAQLKLDIVRMLITHGADVNAEGEFGDRVLDNVLIGTPVEVIQLLLANGADPGLENGHGTTVLHDAVAQDRADLVALFLASGTNVNVRDADRQTPLHEAVWRGNLKMAEMLLAHGADVNARDRRGDMPLHIAMVNGHVQLVDLLVSRGADLTARNRQGLTPAGYARSLPRREMIRLRPEGSRPYSVIITDIAEIRGFLRSLEIDYDRIWVPGDSDISHGEAILNHPRADNKSRGSPGGIQSRTCRYGSRSFQP